MSDLDQLYRAAADRVVREAPPISESTRRRLLDLANRSKQNAPAPALRAA